MTAGRSASRRVDRQRRACLEPGLARTPPNAVYGAGAQLIRSVASKQRLHRATGRAECVPRPELAHSEKLSSSLPGALLLVGPWPPKTACDRL